MADTVPAAQPVPEVAALAALTLQSFLTAAALHLGQALPDGTRLPHPDAHEAWRALLAADALVRALAPWLDDAFRRALQDLAAAFALAHPTLAVPAPDAPVVRLPEAVPAPPEDAGFTVGELVAFSLDALLSAAGAHLGETGADPRSCSPRQAWLALKAAAALLDRLAPLMADAARRPFEAGFARLTLAFAEAHPEFDAAAALPEAPRADLEAIVAAAIAGL